MKFFNRIATCVLIAGLLTLSGCVIADRGHDDRGDPHADARDDHGSSDDRNNGCDSDHHGDGCQDAEHH